MKGIPMNRTQIIQKVIDATNAVRYLEIGIQEQINFNAIKCKYKIGIDPVITYMKSYEATRHNNNFIYGVTSHFQCTSDIFFDEYIVFSHSNNIDVVFIDGLHHAEQVVQDVMNCINFGCTKDAIIVIHDCNPVKEEHQGRSPVVAEWCGDVWKAWVAVKLSVGFVVDCDYGVGIIDLSRYAIKDAKVCSDIISLFNYKDLEKDRKELLNLKSVEYFEQWINKIKESKDDLEHEKV